MGASLERELGGADVLLSARARAAALERASRACSGVLAPRRVLCRPDGVVACEFPVAPGASLAEVDARLTLGQCVTVGIGVARALAAMHAQRLAHGDVSAANVLVRGRRVTLVDTMGALGEERGTPGFAAPERSHGATAAGDVYALGMLLRAVADDDARPVIDAWTAPLLAADAAARPVAEHAAAALARCAPTEPIATPAAPVAAAMRSGGLDRTEKRREDGWWRAERAAVRLSPLAALLVTAVVSGAALVPTVAAAPRHEPRRVADPPIPVAAAALEGPERAAVDLTYRRVAALVEGDGEALLAISIPGSEAAAADASTASALEEGSLRFEGLSLTSATATLRKATPGGAIVEVTSAMSGYSVGKRRVPPGEATAVLELRVTQRGWLVERILPPP